MARTNSKDRQKPSAKSLIFRRGAAYLLDIVILFTVLAPLGFFIQWLVSMDIAETGPEIARTLLWNFSIPAWLYFILSDSSSRGATWGKRFFKLHVVRNDEQRVGFLRAVWRTAVKLLPWEMVHIFGFALSSDLTQLSSVQNIGLITANGLIILYVFLFIATRGRRSVHDFAAQTKVVF
ncbi:MAG: hypothetical protein DHS20C20_26270 [Ardenticatenaceae bacterium]|nr:MAG: hypothetical protein DHS20C20_26270 [Ardenticatenaceae bacterium]